MDVDSIKRTKGDLRSQQPQNLSQGGRTSNGNQSGLSQAARDAVLAVQAELGVALRTAKILAQEGPPISEAEATETASRIAEMLMASGEAFGSSAVLFQDLSPNRSKALLIN